MQDSNITARERDTINNLSKWLRYYVIIWDIYLLHLCWQENKICWKNKGNYKILGKMWKYLEDLQIHRFIDKNRNTTTWTLINEVDSLAFVLLIILSEKDCKTWRPDFLMKGKYYVRFQQEIKKKKQPKPKENKLRKKIKPDSCSLKCNYSS